MKILKIKINEFGILKNKSFDLSNTINIIRGDNESGKSTLMLFIKFMLYGVAKKTRAETYSESDRALNWESLEASGSMTVLHNGKEYRIERRMHKSSAASKAPTSKLQVIDCETELLCDGILNPGEYFLGINSDIFESSCGISQLQCMGIKRTELTGALQNLVSCADESLDAQKAIKVLDTARIKYLHKNGKGGSLFELEERKNALDSQYRQAVEDNAETEKLKEQLESTSKKIEEIAELKKTADELCSKLNLLTVVRLFDKLHEYEQLKNEAESKAEELKAKLTENGFVPDRKFVATVSNSCLELEISKNEFDKANTELLTFHSSLCINDDDAHKIEALDSLGGIDAASTSFKKLKSRTKRLFFLVGASSALTVASVALALLINPLLFAAAGMLAVALALCTSFAVRENKKLTLLCNTLDTDKKNADKFFIRYASVLEELAVKNKEINRLNAVVGIKKKMLEGSLQKLKSDISPFLSLEPDSAEDAIRTAQKVIASISQILDEIASENSVIEAQKAKISDIAANLSDYNEHQVRRKISPEILKMSGEEIKEAQQKKNFYDVQLNSLNTQRATRERALLERKYSTQNPFEILSELDKTEKELEKQKSKYDSLTLAIDTLTQALSNMNSTVTPKLRTLANEYMSRFTDNKYSSVGICEDLALSMSQDGFLHPIDAFSTGTRDIAYIALRLSLLHVLQLSSLPPLLLDETVAMVDDKRTIGVFSILDEYCRRGGQCLLFTCHSREEELCNKNEITHNLIVL